MNPSTLIGIVASVILLAVVLFYTAVDPSLFIDIPGLLVVLVGTMAATFISYPLSEVVRIFGLIGTVLRNEKLYTQDDIDELINSSRLWIAGDIRAVEDARVEGHNPFLKTGVELVGDMTTQGVLVEVLQCGMAGSVALERD